MEEKKEKQEVCDKKIDMRDFILVLVLIVLVFGLSFWCMGKKAEDYSYSERRVLAKMPEVSIENIQKGTFMNEFETYTLDQFPLRDRFRSLKAMVSLGLFQNRDNNDIYYAKGHLSKLEYPLQIEMLDYAAIKMQKIYDMYLKDKKSRCYFSIVPDKNFFLAEKNGYLAMDYEKLFSYMKEKMVFATYLDIVPFLSLEDYYYTDTHWRQEKIVDVAEYLKSAMNGEKKAAGTEKEMGDWKATIPEKEKIEGTERTGLSVYEEKKLEQDFYGVYYGQAALPVAPDTLYYLTNETLENCIVTSYDTGKAKAADLYDMKKAEGKDAYELFLTGANALLTIENPTAEEGKELIVFRDSFGSSLVPLLVDNYAKITVIDIRYVQSEMLGRLVDFHGQDTLFIYSTLILNQSRALK